MDQKTFDLIEKIAKEHCNKTFGYLDKNDLKNEIWVICLEKLHEYDPSRGVLEHFLRRAVKTRLINRYKDVTKPVRSPCTRCKFFNPLEDNFCGKFGKEYNNCRKYNNHRLSVESRNSLINSVEEYSETMTPYTTLDLISNKEMQASILEHLDESLHSDFRQMVTGGKISKRAQDRLRRAIILILTGLGYWNE